jgi:D-arginine dehydrogenase
MQSFDFIIVGAGIAGASAAWALSGSGSVLVLEAESHPGYHTTGRSAAIFTETYGSPTVGMLTKASRSFLEQPPPDFTEHPLLKRRQSLYLARVDQLDRLDALEAHSCTLDVEIRRLSALEVHDMVPILRADYVAAGLLEPGAMEIDVDQLHQGFLRTARRFGAHLLTDTSVTSIQRHGDLWRVAAGEEEFSGRRLINAAGAWADNVARMAGVPPLGICPLRRTVALIDPPEGVDISHWPLVIDAAEQFYFKPDAGLILVSPADETPSLPCDCQAEEVDVAMAIHRLQRAADISVHRVRRSWAGLRSFAADRDPVCGPDPLQPDFIWLAGQGGYGIGIAPALARLVASHITGRAVPSEIAQHHLLAERLSPGRLRQGAIPGISPRRPGSS